jgi:hypothetical protein
MQPSETWGASQHEKLIERPHVRQSNWRYRPLQPVALERSRPRGLRQHGHNRPLAAYHIARKSEHFTRSPAREIAAERD